MRAALILLSVMIVGGCAPSPAPDPRVDGIVDRLAVQDVVNELFVSVDQKAWDRARATLADEVYLDMTSLTGGEPADVAADVIVEGWARDLGPIQAVHHQTGNFSARIDGDAATVSCYGTATHYRPESEKRLTYFVGSYDFHLIRVNDGWKIDRLRFNAKYVE